MSNKLFNKLLELFHNMDDSDVVIIWNEYIRNVNRFDDEILPYYELEEWINSSNDDTIDILNRFYFGSDEGRDGTSANPNRNFFTFNGYGNIISFDYLYNQYQTENYGYSYIDISDLINYIIENNDSLYNDEIAAILEEK